MKTLSKTSSSPRETKEIAASLATSLKPGDVVALIGELGAGKSCFVEGVVEELHGSAETTSPSYTLINEYDAKTPPIYHIDLYRLEDPSELEELGYDDYLSGNGISLVEWFDNIPEQGVREYIRVKITQLKDDKRSISIQRIKL